ncbi:MAG: phycobilisome protein [Cyanobacteria bacterium P01_E01_bin.34]
MSGSLSETLKQLIAKARIVSFAEWSTEYSAEAIAIFQAADNNRHYLTDEDYDHLAALSPALPPDGVALASALRDLAEEIVAEARGNVLSAFPGITDPGGGLYPPQRAEACWRDFWQFLRCITYGVAAQQPSFTSTEGLHYMQLLYQELQVPLDAMVMGIEQLKAASLNRFPEREPALLEPYFDHLGSALDRFRRSPNAA